MVLTRNLLFFLFALSGFSGLVYESIWTHYLKLFLGHAAYAQTLVLAIFMGGMAIGAWWSGTGAKGWKNLLLGYALVEGVIGIGALLFHDVFDMYLRLAYETLLPALGSPTLVSLVKWSSAGLLILPQSILLGMTFPLMSGALIRRFPSDPGASISMLYFTNSIGATAGVLVSGFVLVEALGLPGTIRLAGVINILLALWVWYLARDMRTEPQFKVPQSDGGSYQSGSWFWFFLVIALVTGAASFIYEIAWIRMLSLVLGASTHAFELMLSAFILGLALGGLWIRRRIDHIDQPIRYLAVVQLLMGLAAASTLFIYNQTFDVMAWMMGTLDRDSTGYTLFNIGSHGIAALVMLPTTFLAGMTLPLITYTLMTRGHGEKSIGSVYAANTTGAILGVFFATHVGMPAMGLKGVLLLGGLLDVALGVILLWRFKYLTGPLQPVTALVVVLLGMLALFGQLDPLKMVSGVYRTGTLIEGGAEIKFHKDGKTASIDVMHTVGRFNQPVLSILTNGKPDAAVNMSPWVPPRSDESTMILAGALPLLYNPEAKTAAVIGMGSGLSTNTLLTTDQLQVVDTIEIEAAMLEGAQLFRPKVELAYTDTRSHFYVDDAKTFFLTYNKQYDIILSEPSNPWVSGVSNLFTAEFYHLIKRHLTANGILVQWIQAYEIDNNLVASIVKSLVREFPHYAIYGSNNTDLIIVARAQLPVTTPQPRQLWPEGLAAELDRIHIKNNSDLELHRVGGNRALTPLFASYPLRNNSDYYPVVDLNAARTRYMRQSAANIISFRSASLPVVEMLDGQAPPVIENGISNHPYFKRTQYALDAYRIVNYLVNDDELELTRVDPGFAATARQVKEAYIYCNGAIDDRALVQLTSIVNLIMPQLPPQMITGLWQRLQAVPCAGDTASRHGPWLQLWQAVSARNAQAMLQQARIMLPAITGNSLRAQKEYILMCNLLGHLLLDDAPAAQRIWSQYASIIYSQSKPALAVRLLAAHAFQGTTIPYID